MKTASVILLWMLAIQLAGGQNRIAEKISFKSGEETLTGILVKPGDSKQIADSVNRLLKDESLAKKLGENGRKRVEEHFSWVHIAKQTKQMYERLL